MPAPFWLRSGFDAPAPRFKREGSGAVFRASSLLQAGGASTLSPRFGAVLPPPQEGGFLVVRSLFVASGQGSSSAVSPCFALASSRRRDMPFPAPPAPLPALRRVRTAPVHGVHAVRSGAFWRASAGCLRHASASSASVRRSTMSRAFRSPASALATRAFASFALTL